MTDRTLFTGGRHVGWNLEDGMYAVGGVVERDVVLEGVARPPQRAVL